MTTMGRPADSNGRATPDATVARVMLRPIGSPLPLGAFTLVPAGLFFLSCGALFALLMGGGFAGGKAGAGAMILAGSARFIVSGLYELTSSHGVEHAAGIIGLVFVGVAGYVGLAALLEDTAKRSLLPLGRRSRAREAIDAGLEAQLRQLETEAGVREQL